jgi:hypothetical protein
MTVRKYDPAAIRALALELTHHDQIWSGDRRLWRLVQAVEPELTAALLEIWRTELPCFFVWLFEGAEASAAVDVMQCCGGACENYNTGARTALPAL